MIMSLKASIRKFGRCSSHSIPDTSKAQPKAHVVEAHRGVEQSNQGCLRVNEGSQDWSFASFQLLGYLEQGTELEEQA